MHEASRETVSWRGAKSLAVFLVVAGAAVVLYREINVTFVEFSPNWLGMRERHDTCIPVLRIAVNAPIVGEWRRSELMSFLVDQGYFQPDRKMISWIGVGNRLPTLKQLDCSLLIDELSDDAWIPWTEANPDTAALLWNEVEYSLKERAWYDGIPRAEELLVNAARLRNDEAAMRAYLEVAATRDEDEI